MKRKNKASGELYICGAGIDRPHDVTLHTIATLKNCDVMFYIHGDWPHMAPFFKEFCRDIRTFSGRPFETMTDEARVEFVGKLVCRELRLGLRVVYMTYGHPLIFSDGYNMAEYCRLQGYGCRVIAAPSSIDSILAAMDNRLDLLSHGFSVCSASRIIKDRSFHLRSDAPLIVLGLDALVKNEGFDMFCDLIEATYPKGHPIHCVKCRDGSSEKIYLSSNVQRLRGLKNKIVHMMSLVLPAAPAAEA